MSAVLVCSRVVLELYRLLQISVRPFSLYLIPGNLSRDLGQSAVILLIPKRVFHRQPLCVETVDLSVPPYSLEREGVDSPGN